VIIRHLIVPLTVAALTLHAGQAFAQDASPAPLPDQAAALPSGGASEACMNGFASLRQEAEARGKLIKAASERHAPPDEACKLIGSFRQSEIRMIRYIEANSATCGISPELADQLRAGHKNTEAMQRMVCAVARQAQRGGPAGPVGDFDDIDAGKL
jgi:hypothetical protein